MSLAIILTKKGQKQQKSQTARENSCYSNAVVPRETSPSGEKEKEIALQKNEKQMDRGPRPTRFSGYKNARWSSPISESSSKSQEVCYTPAYL